MSTRAVYTFKDERESYAVYKHYDGYPSGAVEFIKSGIEMSWGGGRFEASDLSAAFVAANKKQGGDVYLTKGQNRHGDLSYDYVIYYKNNEIWIDAFNHDWEEKNGEYKKIRIRIYRGLFATYYTQKAEPQADAA